MQCRRCGLRRHTALLRAELHRQVRRRRRLLATCPSVSCGANKNCGPDGTCTCTTATRAARRVQCAPAARSRNAGACCTPNCTNSCGGPTSSDGCGGTCQAVTCTTNKHCSSGNCVCDAGTCGASCAVCDDGDVCNAGTVPRAAMLRKCGGNDSLWRYLPDSQLRRQQELWPRRDMHLQQQRAVPRVPCGDGDEVCNAGTCCAPQCSGKCGGSDSCGGTCPTVSCGANKNCGPGGTCICNNNTCGASCAVCDGDEVCNAGTRAAVPAVLWQVRRQR